MKIGLVGLAGAGKDTVAVMLLEKLRDTHGKQFRLERFASPLKQVTRLIFGADFDVREVKEVFVPIDPDSVLNHTFYLLMDVLKFTDAQMDKAGELYADTIGQYDKLSPRMYQQLLGTEIVRAIDPDAWAKRLARHKYDVICPDVRFMNELHIFDKLVFISRGEVPKNVHTSEVLASEIQLGLDDTTPDYWITNNGSLNDLEAKVNDLIKVIL